MNSDNTAKIHELKNKIAFWTSRLNRIKNPVEKAVLQDKIKEANSEITRIETDKQVSITNPIGTPVIADKNISNHSNYRRDSKGFGRVFL